MFGVKSRLFHLRSADGIRRVVEMAVDESKIVFTAPITRTSLRRIECLEAVWFVGEEAHLLHPSSESNSPPLPESSIAQFVAGIAECSDELGDILIFESRSVGLIVARRVAQGWLVGSTSVGVNSADALSSLKGFERKFASRFVSTSLRVTPGELGGESTEVAFGSSDPSRVATPESWDDVAQWLNDWAAEAPGRVRMFGWKSWRSESHHDLPIHFDLETSFHSSSRARPSAEELRNLETVVQRWVEGIERACGDVPQSMKVVPRWCSTRLKEIS